MSKLPFLISIIGTQIKSMHNRNGRERFGGGGGAWALQKIEQRWMMWRRRARSTTMRIGKSERAKRSIGTALLDPCHQVRYAKGHSSYASHSNSLLAKHRPLVFSHPRMPHHDISNTIASLFTRHPSSDHPGPEKPQSFVYLHGPFQICPIILPYAIANSIPNQLTQNPKAPWPVLVSRCCRSKKTVETNRVRSSLSGIPRHRGQYMVPNIGGRCNSSRKNFAPISSV